jgi:cytochrome c553
VAKVGAAGCRPPQPAHLGTLAWRDRLCGQFLIGLIFLGGVPAPALAEALSERLAPCLACHGEGGRSETPEVPSLGGQPSDFLLIQLYQFREKQRLGEPMNELAEDLSDDDLRAYAESLSRLPPPAPAEQVADPSAMARGRALSAKHRCGFCHNPDFSGHDQIPRLAAQREDYLIKALRAYKSGARVGYDPAMAEVVQPISDPEILDLAAFLARSG